MAAVTAKITSPDVTITSRRKGEVGNFIRLKQIIDPAGATGATTVSVSGLDITVKLKNTSGTTITATVAEVLSAISGSAKAQGLISATLTAAATGANTGSAFTGTGGAFVSGSSGAEGTGTVTYDDLAAATGDGWTQVGNSLEKVRGENSNFPGTIERQSAITGAGLALAAGRTQLRAARKGFASPIGL